MRKLLNITTVASVLTSLMISGNVHASNSNSNNDEGLPGSHRAAAVNPMFAHLPIEMQAEAQKAFDDIMGAMQLGQIENIASDDIASANYLANLQSNLNQILKSSEDSEKAKIEEAHKAQPEIPVLNKRLESAVEQNNADEVTLLLNSAAGELKPDMAGIFDALKATLRTNNTGMTTLILNLSAPLLNKMYFSGCIDGLLNEAFNTKNWQMIDILCTGTAANQRPSELGIAASLSRAGAANDKEIITYLLDYIASEQLCLETLGVAYTVDEATKKGHIELVSYILQYVAEHSLNLSQGDVDSLLEKACHLNHEGLALSLLARSGRDVQPATFAMGRAMGFAITAGNPRIVAALLNRAEGQLNLLHHDIDNAFERAALNGNLEIVTLFLNQQGQNRLSDYSIIAAHRNAVAGGQQAVADLIAPYVPAEEVQNQAPAYAAVYIPGLNRGAFEIHDYSETLVNISPSDSDEDTSAPKAKKQVRLIDAVFKNLTTKVNELRKLCIELEQPDPLLNFEEACSIINDNITAHIAADKQKAAREAVFFKLGSDKDFEKQICLAVTYIRLFHLERMDTWIAGFVEESITAYNNSINGTSCSKGIRERIGTGLRNIDKELDALFSQAEAPLLVANYMKLWEPSAKVEIQAELLIAGGLTAESTAEEAGELVKKLITQRILASNLSMNDYEYAIESLADYVSGNYDVIKAAVLELLNKPLKGNDNSNNDTGK